jgi:hypothetical protein
MNTSDSSASDWKLKLRYGQISTPYTHYTALAEGKMTKKDNDFDCPLGSAWMAMKTWATDASESADMIRVIGNQIGFEITGRTEIYETEAKQPPRENPFGYDIGFTPFTEK